MDDCAGENRLEQIRQWVESHLAERGDSGTLERVEAVGEGRLLAQVRQGRALPWYEIRGENIRERVPQKDRKVPLGQLLIDARSDHFLVLSHRPGKRLTLLDKRHDRLRVLKGFREGRLARMLERYEIAVDALASRRVHAPEVVEIDTDLHAMAISFRSGDRLHLSPEAVDLFHLVGESLREFQQHGSAAGLDTFSREDECTVIDKRARRLTANGFELPEGWRELRNRLTKAAGDLPEPVYVLAHRDLHDKQFVQHNSDLTLLDFDLMDRADTCLDAGNLLAHLTLRNLQGVQGATPRSIDACGGRFLQGLERSEEAGFRERLRFYQASTFCRLALIYLTRTRWTGVVGQLVTMGQRCLDDLDRIRGTEWASVDGC